MLLFISYGCTLFKTFSDDFWQKSCAVINQNQLESAFLFNLSLQHATKTLWAGESGESCRNIHPLLGTIFSFQCKYLCPTLVIRLPYNGSNCLRLLVNRFIPIVVVQKLYCCTEMRPSIFKKSFYFGEIVLMIKSNGSVKILNNHFVLIRLWVSQTVYLGMTSIFLTHHTHKALLNLGHLAKEEMKGSDSSSVQVLRTCLLQSSTRAALCSFLDIANLYLKLLLFKLEN